jgi:hypothetical protein
VMTFIAAGALAAGKVTAGGVKGGGVLTSIERDGTIVIDKVGYFVSPSVTVQDRNGNNISLRDIPVPSNVLFEYEYAPKGFTIVFIKQAAG